MVMDTTKHHMGAFTYTFLVHSSAKLVSSLHHADEENEAQRIACTNCYIRASHKKFSFHTNLGGIRLALHAGP